MGSYYSIKSRKDIDNLRKILSKDGLSEIDKEFLYSAGKALESFPKTHILKELKMYVSYIGANCEECGIDLIFDGDFWFYLSTKSFGKMPSCSEYKMYQALE